MTSKWPRKTLAALGKVFAAEISDRLPFQSQAKIYKELCDQGLLERMQRVYGGRFPVTCSGYRLTHTGRIIYCENCDDTEEEGNE